MDLAFLPVCFNCVYLKFINHKFVCGFRYNTLCDDSPCPYCVEQGIDVSLYNPRGD